MKLFLFCLALLLVPLALASQRPANKVLYDDDFVISEGFDLIIFQYFYYNHNSDYRTDFTRFEALNNKSSDFHEMVQLKGDPRKQGLSFALESFPYVKEINNSRDALFCQKNSSENLRQFIDYCDNTIRLRNLTDEEREQLQQFKNERRGKETPFFKVIYKNNAVTTKSVGVDDFLFHNFYDFIITSRSGPNRTEASLRIEHDRSVHFPNKSFVIESVPANRPHNCNSTVLKDMKPYSCEGQIQVRPLRADD